MALTEGGKIYVWGNNNFGQLGIGSLNSINIPIIVDALNHEKVIDISCGDNFSGAITESGEVYTWGFGNEGQLGHGDKSDQMLPRKIQINEKIKKISCGGAHAAFLT
jgi:alpha-tubulin suppressor-like RCC1 family protein